MAEIKDMIAFILKTKNGKFKVVCGTTHESPGDNDSIIHITANAHTYPDEVQAQNFIKDNPADFKYFKKVYLKPMESSDMGLWLSVLENNNKDNYGSNAYQSS